MSFALEEVGPIANTTLTEDNQSGINPVRLSESPDLQ